MEEKQFPIPRSTRAKSNLDMASSSKSTANFRSEIPGADAMSYQTAASFGRKSNAFNVNP